MPGTIFVRKSSRIASSDSPRAGGIDGSDARTSPGVISDSTG
jgi:hypothetical protein